MINLLPVILITVEQYIHHNNLQLSSILPNEKALKRLIDRHWEKLLAYCQHYTQDSEASNEIVQDIFCSLWDRRADHNIRITAIDAYLFSAARRKIARYYRDKYRDERHYEAASIKFVEETNVTEERVHYDDMQRHIATLVDQLPERCGEVYILSRGKGLAIREIAGKLSISEKTVESHLTKALKFLRKQLQKERY